jgi:hypothetical protein
MKKLTNNQFKFGAISQKIIRNIWRNNKLITYKEFAKLWLNDYDNGYWSSKKFSELAYNNFDGSIDLWNKHRNEVLKLFYKYKLLSK